MAKIRRMAVASLFLLIGICVSSAKASNDSQCAPGKYNKYERPYAGVEPTNISLTVYVRNMNSIDEGKFLYNLDYILYHRYNDPRLASDCVDPEFLKNVRKVNDIWFPNLGLINCHSSKEVKNSEKVTIQPNGDVFAHKRMTTQCYCIMDLHAFPMDKQRCPFRLESYTYSMADISLNWWKTPIQFEEGLELVGYTLGNSTANKILMTYSYGTWEVMEALFVVHREYLYYVYRVYVPTFLLMIFNFTSYWIPHSAMPARVTLIITTFLTITFILQHVTAQTAKATTTTSLQVFLIFSIALVVVAILELMLVLFFTNRKKKMEEQELEENTEESKDNSFHNIETTMPSIDSFHGEKFQAIDVATLRNRAIPASEVEARGVGTETDGYYSPALYPVIEFVQDFDMANLDRIFRFLAPFIYIVFCFAYFGYYLCYD